MKIEDVEFLAELYSKVNELENLVKSRGYENRVMSAIVIGLMDEVESTEDDDDDLVGMKSLFSYNLDSRDELEVIIDIMKETYTDDNDGLSDMLSDLGISLN
jgi:hypothetical protein